MAKKLGVTIAIRTRSWTNQWRKRLRALVRKEAVERELDEELALHLELETEKNLRAGMTHEEARRQAALAFGGVEKHKEAVRDARVPAGRRARIAAARLSASVDPSDEKWLRLLAAARGEPLPNRVMLALEYERAYTRTNCGV